LTPGPTDSSVRLKRLEALADVWGKVYLFHPAIVAPSQASSLKPQASSNEFDWNQALIRAIARVEAAETADDLAKVINEEMLQPLGDLLTYAYVKEPSSHKPQATSGKLEAGRLSDAIGYLRIPSSEGGWSRDSLHDFQSAVEALDSVEKLVVDMRWYAGGAVPSDVAVMLRFFVQAGLLTGPVLKRVHQGWNEDNGVNAYKQEWKVIAGTRLDPIQQVDWPWARSLYGVDFRRLPTITKPTVVLVNRPSAIGTYKILEALRSQPGIAVVYEPSGPAGTFAEFRLDYPEGLSVQLNTERLIGHDGQTGFSPDVTASEPIGSDQLASIAEQALAVRTKDQGPGTKDQAASLINLKLPRPSTEAREDLSREERLLGLFKVWNLIRFLDPHLELCDMDWYSCLPEWIPQVEAVDSLVVYVRTLRMLTAHLHDNNVFYFFPNMPEPQALPVVFGWVEGKVIVAEVLQETLTAHGSRLTAVSGQPSAVGSAGLEIGDELVELDGKTVPELVADHRLQVSYSTEGSFYQRMCDMLALGPSGSEVKLVVRRGNMGTVPSENGDATAGSPTQPLRGSVPLFAQDADQMGTVPGSRTGPCEGTVPILHITLKRTVTREAWVAHSARRGQSAGYRLLDGNIGYMDLSQLTSLAEFERAFEALRQADGLIIDIRGYPGFMVQLALSARLNDRPVKSAIFETPVVSSYDRMEQGWDIGQYEVKPDPKLHYGGPVIVLINERTRGTAEDLGIYLKDAKRVTFVGGPTAGCNGNRTWLSLPGAGRMFFTGMRVKFGDGSRFQNIGILPDVPVAPTVEGIRAGKDEVLEKGIEVLGHLVQRPSSSAPKQSEESDR
jgi:C-terminal processing protease CtpA/Prc